METIVQNEIKTGTEIPSVIDVKVVDVVPNTFHTSLLKQESLCIPEEQVIVVSDDSYSTIIDQNIKIKNFTNDFNGEIQNNIFEPDINFKTTDDESMAVEALRQLGGMYNNVITTEENLPVLSCDNCEATFHTSVDLNIHSISCKNLDYRKFKRCTFCTMLFQNENDYDNHNCELLEQWPCKFCGEKLSTNLALIKHIRSIHNNESRPYKCHLCNQKFPRHSSLSNHLKIHNYQPGRALFINCDNKYKHEITKNAFKLPVWSSESDINSDNISSISTDPLSNWNFNCNSNSVQIEYHQDIIAENDLIVTNNFTQNDIPQQVAIEYEIPVKVESMPSFSTEIDKCVEDPFTISNIPQIEVTIDSTEQDKKPHTCSECGMSFSREKALANHINLHTINWESTHDCTYCGEIFNNKNIKMEHIKYCTKSNVQNTDNTLEHITNKSNNNLIKKQFKCNTKFLNTSKPQVKVGKHPCPECDKRFATKQKMFRHMWIHRKKIFTCEMCAMTFEFQIDLDKHRLSQHPTDSPYVCQECGKSFASRQGLWEHSRVHGSGSTGLFCQKCKKTFASRQGYLIHQRSHTGERPYGCRYCLKAFRDGGTLRKHERIHTGERPHVCPICLSDFNQKVVLREHVRWRHAAYRQENENGLYSCQICQVYVSDKEELCAHIVKHSDQMAVVQKNITPKMQSNSKFTKIAQPKSTVKIENNIKLKDSLLCSGNYNKDESVNIQTNVQCDMCGENFISQKELMAHVHIHI